MSACYSCNETLNKKNQSFEHIIPNSIGGTLKSARLLCRQCNTAYGMTIDAALAADFEPLAATLNIKRDRPKHDATENTIFSNGDLNNLEKNPVEDELLTTDPVGNELFMRSIAKIAVNYYLMKTRGRRHLQRIINIINGSESNSNDIHYYPVPDNTHSNDEISHVIIIKGNSVQKQLYAHIILFSTYSFIVSLCNEYDGENVEYNYHYEISRGENIRNIISR